MNKLYPALLLFFISNFVSAQSELCLTDMIWAEMVRQDSSLYYRRMAEDDAIAKFTNAALQSQPSKQRRSLMDDNPTVIPTVIYIIHDGTPASNISMQQIQSQMDQLNQNFDSLGIQFCFAKRNVSDTSYFVPQTGDSAGVFRINSALTNIDQQVQDAQLKALSALPSQNYLRIFVVKSIAPTGVLGYAYFPGSSVSLDGIVVRADVFGSRNFCPSCNLLSQYDLGAALTHEAGHYLNLYHTFQGGCVTGNGIGACGLYGDRVCDTPPTTGSYGCPSPAPLSCDSIPVPVLIENYMDYTHDACKTSFTTGQQARMAYSLQAYRLALISNQNLINTGITCADLGNLYADFYCANFNGCRNRAMTFKSLASAGFTYTWSFGDGGTATGSTVNHSYASNGEFTVTLRAVNTSQSVDVTGNVPVFITDCSPINCRTNKWDFEYGFLDFSSGNAVATNHPPLSPITWNFPEFYNDYYRADSTGNALFHIGIRTTNPGGPNAPGLIDSSYNLIDTFGWSYGYSVIRVLGRLNTYCVIGGYTDSFRYSIVHAPLGNAGFVPGRKLRSIPFPAGTVISNHYFPYTAGIPSCDGTKMWVVLREGCSRDIYVFRLDSSMNLVHHQTYNLGSNRSCWDFVVSPDGRKLISHETNTSNDWMVFHFDKSTGYLTGHSVFYIPPSSYWAWNGSFSPNSRFFYQPEWINQYNTTNVMYQYDMLSPNPYATRKEVYRYNKSVPFGSQCNLGPDGKIYVGFNTTPINAPESYRLAVINHPDVLETGQNTVGFNMNGPDIKPPSNPNSGINLTGFSDFSDLQDADNCNFIPGRPLPFGYTAIASSCRSYQFHSDDCFPHIWNFGDPASGAYNTTTASNPVHVFSAAGNYLVSRTINGETSTDTIKVELPAVQIAETGLQNCFSLRGNYSIVLPQSNVNYSWSITGGQPAYVPSAIDVDIAWDSTTASPQIKVVAVNSISGCSDSITIVNFDFASSFSHSICPGNSYVFNGQNLSSPGSYSDTLVNVRGCDSIVTLTLSINNIPPTSLSASICDGDTVLFGNSALTVAGIYTHIITTANGCDSIVNLNLSINNIPPTSLSASLCAGDSIVFGNNTLTVPGIYTHIITTSNGCDSAVTLNLSLDNLPQPTIFRTLDTLRTQTFTDYQWLRNGTVITGATSQSLTLTQTGSYLVVVTNGNGCSDTSAVLNVSSVGISDMVSDFGVTLYPNPASDNVILQLDVSQSNTFSIAIQNIEGRQVAAVNNLGWLQEGRHNTTIDISTLSNGFYLVGCKSSNGIVYKKLVVQR